MSNLTYEERLRIINLPTLIYRRMRGDMIETFKILKEFYDQTAVPQLQRSTRPSRGHHLKLFLGRTRRLDIRKHYFSNRIVTTWNALPDHVVRAETINVFKSRLDHHWRDHPLKFNWEYNTEQFT